MATRVRMTAEDLWRLGTGDVRRELVDGEITEMTPTGGTHDSSWRGSAVA
jgi:Uma2 family endonuclease